METINLEELEKIQPTRDQVIIFTDGVKYWRDKCHVNVNNNQDLMIIFTDGTNFYMSKTCEFYKPVDAEQLLDQRELDRLKCDRDVLIVEFVDFLKDGLPFVEPKPEIISHISQPLPGPRWY